MNIIETIVTSAIGIGIGLVVGINIPNSSLDEKSNISVYEKTYTSCVQIAYVNGRSIDECNKIKNVVNKEEKTCNDSFRDTVYLVSEKDIERLPFCGMLYGSNEEDVYYTDSTYSTRAHACYDWTGWDEHGGICIINLDDKK